MKLDLLSVVVTAQRIQHIINLVLNCPLGYEIEVSLIPEEREIYIRAMSISQHPYVEEKDLISWPDLYDYLKRSEHFWAWINSIQASGSVKKHVKTIEQLMLEG